MQKYLECGIITNTHGINGRVKVLSQCDTPEDLASLEYVYIEQLGVYRELEVTSASVYKDTVIFTFDGIDSIDKASRLKGKTLYADRDDFGLEEGEYFLADVIGCKVIDENSGKVYGVIEGVTDRDYYTNSFHVPVYYSISAFKKIQKEAPFHALTNAGHISYVELDGDTCKNIDAFESVIRCMKEAGIGYGSVNHPVDRDPVCGYNGIIGDVCPRCGRRAGEGVPVEKLLELKKRYHDVPDYSHLIR